MSYPHILHHGAMAGVTGSCHQLRMDAQHSLLADCGLFQGADDASPHGDTGGDNLAIDFPISSIKAPAVSRVHIDRIGRIPYLLIDCGHQAYLSIVKRLAEIAQSTIVISAVGICAGGCIVDYLQSTQHDSWYDVSSVGYKTQGAQGMRSGRVVPVVFVYLSMMCVTRFMSNVQPRWLFGSSETVGEGFCSARRRIAIWDLYFAR